MARYEEVQAAQIREGEHRGAANRLRTEHKEVGSGPGAGSAEVGADGGPTPAGSGESFPASFDRMVAFFRRSKGVFQQAVQFTALPSPKRYDNRYEQEFLKNIRPHQLPTRTWWWARGWGRGGNWYPLCNEYLLREQAHNA